MGRRLGATPKADIVVKNGQLVDVVGGAVRMASVAIRGRRIVRVGESVGALVGSHTKVIDAADRYLLPGLWDTHLHIESTMLTPTEFARAVLPRGTTSVVADPHEIANVMGLRGVRIFYKEAQRLPLKIFFMAPSCVPAAPGLDTPGAELGLREVSVMLHMPNCLGLAEVMNFPGVIKREEKIMRMIEEARSLGKVVDGHAPGLTGDALRSYVEAGITSDHESSTAQEAIEKLKLGMRLMVREGSVAKNLSTVIQAIRQANMEFDNCMLATDDLTPLDLARFGHIDHLVRRAVEEGVDEITVIRMGTINAARYFRQEKVLGSLDPPKIADLVISRSLRQLRAETVIANGRIVAKNGRMTTSLRQRPYPKYVTRTFRIERPVSPEELAIKAPLENGEIRVRAIGAIDGQVVTERAEYSLEVKGGRIFPSVEAGVLQLVVVERHRGTGNIGLGFVRGFELKEGALASSVAHDSHNIIAVGATWDDMAHAINTLVRLNGGLIAVKNRRTVAVMRLPICGLMSTSTTKRAANDLDRLLQAARGMGERLTEPFMTLSFLALPVIPELKLTDKGLFDVREFRFVDVAIT